MTPGSMVSVTLVSAVMRLGDRAADGRGGERRARGRRGEAAVAADVDAAVHLVDEAGDPRQRARGAHHARQRADAPGALGPVIVPESVRPCGSEIVGQPAAGVTSAGPVGRRRRRASAPGQAGC